MADDDSLRESLTELGHFISNYAERRVEHKQSLPGELSLPGSDCDAADWEERWYVRPKDYSRLNVMLGRASAAMKNAGVSAPLKVTDDDPNKPVFDAFNAIHRIGANLHESITYRKQFLMLDLPPKGFLDLFDSATEVAASATGGSAIKETKSSESETLSGEAKAIALLVQYPEWTDTKIAETVPCSRTTLYTWPRFMAARKAKKQNSRPPSGRKDRESGRIEAVDD